VTLFLILNLVIRTIALTSRYHQRRHRDHHDYTHETTTRHTTTGGNTARPAPQVAAGPEPDAALATTLAVSNSQQEARAPHYDRSRSEPAGQEGEDKAGWLRMLQVYTKSSGQKSYGIVACLGSRGEDETFRHNGHRPPSRQGFPARPRRLDEGLDAALPRSSSPAATLVKGSTSRRLGRRLAQSRPAPPWLPPLPLPATVAPESPPLNITHHHSLRLCPTHAVVRLARALSCGESGDYRTSMDWIRRPMGEKEGERKREKKIRK
jgi:hypothetical protein